MSFTIDNPVNYFPQVSKFGAVGGGSLYIGVVDGDPANVPADRIQVYKARQNDTDLAISQPISLSPGGVPMHNGSAITIKNTGVEFSMQVIDSQGQQIFYSPKSGEIAAAILTLQTQIASLNFIKPVETFAALATTAATVSGMIVYTKQHTSGGVGGNFFEDRAGTITNNGGTLINNTVTAGRHWAAINYSEITTSMFGAIGDGVTDDTAAVQKAIDFCVPQPASIPAKKLIVDGRCLITSSLYIDRATDATVNLFEIEGHGESSGFLQNTGFTLFDSRAAYGPAAGLYTKSPVTEFTVFKNVVFENSIGSASGFIFNEKFLRLAFNGCRFRGIRGGTGTDFWQSIKFYNCHFRGNNGVFLQNLDGYDIRVIDCEFESAGLGFNFTGVLRGSSIESGLCQNTTVPIIEVNNGNGVTVDKMYFENNTGTNYIKFGSGTSDGVNVTNNTFLLSGSQEADTNYWPVAFGAAKHGSLIGNYSSGNIADAASTAQFAISHSGNGAPINRLVISDLPIITPNAAGTQVAATKIRTKCAICQGGALNSSVILPQIAASQEVDVIIVTNQGSDTIRVFPFSGERILGLAYNAATTIVSGASKHFINSLNNDYWVEY